MSNLLARKPLHLLMEEARETGEHSLRRTLGPVQLTALGVGAIIGAGIFVLSGLGAHYAGPGLMLEYAMGASTVSSGWSNHFVELLNIFHLKMPLWLAYDHWTALRTAEKIVARQMAQISDPSLVPGTQAFLNKVTAIMSAGSPELVQRAHALLGAPNVFGVEVGFNLPAFCIALIITAILAIGIRESARFNAVIVAIKVSVVLFVIGLGFQYVSKANWGMSWS